MQRLALLAAALALSGCVSGNELGGVIENAVSSKQALYKAEAHCAKYGKRAKPHSYDALGSLTFECVPK